MQQQYDVLIVGGGLAGSSLALALQNSGLEIAIVETNDWEQRRLSPAGDRALALANGTVRMLDKLGVWQAVKHAATAIKHIHVSDQGHFGKTRLSAAQEGVAGLGYVITAREIEAQLAEQLRQTDITQYCPARVVGLAADAEWAYISIMCGQESINLSAKLVVGADGGNSTVRKLLGIKQQFTEYGQTAIVTTVKSSCSHNNTAYERFTPSGPLALLPYHEQCAVVWTRRNDAAEILMSDSEAEFLQQLQHCFGYKLGEFALSAPRRGFPLALIRAEHMVLGRTVIIGNAAHQLHPVAGQGFNLGLRDVVLLAEMLLQQHQSQSDIGAMHGLQKYARQRQQDHDKVVRFTDGLVRIFSNEWRPLAAVRNLGLALLDHNPPAKSILARYAMGLSARMPNFEETRD